MPKEKEVIVAEQEIDQAQSGTKFSLMPGSAEALIAKAIDKNVPVETMERLMAMRRELRSEMAKSAFDQAMAKFQAECPMIQKTKEVRTKAGAIAYRYAPIESIVAQVKDRIRDNGFSYAIDTETLEGTVKAICIVKHELGHSEQSSFEVPLGNKTDVMSQSQVVAAALTFAKRYAFCNAFGIMTGDEDNDGQTDAVRSPAALPAIGSAEGTIHRLQKHPPHPENAGLLMQIDADLLYMKKTREQVESQIGGKKLESLSVNQLQKVYDQIHEQRLAHIPIVEAESTQE